MPQTIERPARNGHADPLPPNSAEAEAGFLASCIQRPDLIRDQFARVRPDVFYDVRHGVIWNHLRAMSDRSLVIDAVTFFDRLKKEKAMSLAGGHEYVASLPDKSPSPENARYYLDIVLEKHALRKAAEVLEFHRRRALEPNGNADDYLMHLRADVETLASMKAGEQKTVLKVWKISELEKWEPPDHLRLVGDNEITCGYEGLTLIAGPGSAGKSLAAASLALAGAIGSGFWMGRKVHRQFKTLIIQAENGPVRMKSELEAMQKAHPQVNLDEFIFITEPPEGGLPFHRPEFRVAVRREIERIKPSLVVLDPWSQIATEDSAKEVVDKLAEIRSCFPSGDDCPGLLIVAHTKKPRPEDVRRGRSMAYNVAGSVALPNTARCVYLLLPWSDELDDERIYWSCPKLNNGKMYPATVWRRRFGTFFDHDTETDPREWGQEKDEREERRTIEPDDLSSAFGSESVLKKSTLARRIEESTGAGYSTIMRAITPGKYGYLAGLVEETSDGWIKLKKPKK